MDFLLAGNYRNVLQCSHNSNVPKCEYRRHENGQFVATRRETWYVSPNCRVTIQIKLLAGRSSRALISIFAVRRQQTNAPLAPTMLVHPEYALFVCMHQYIRGALSMFFVDVVIEWIKPKRHPTIITILIIWAVFIGRQRRQVFQLNRPGNMLLPHLLQAVLRRINLPTDTEHTVQVSQYTSRDNRHTSFTVRLG